MIKFLETLRLFKNGRLSNGAIALSVGFLFGDSTLSMTAVTLFLLTDLVLSSIYGEKDAQRQFTKDAALNKANQRIEAQQELIKQLNDGRGINRNRY